MARDRKHGKVNPSAGHQLALDGLAEERPPPPPRKPRVIQQLPYEERVTRWFLAREEAMKKRK